ncbi:unnamed protein product [Urochloa humidicola]
MAASSRHEGCLVTAALKQDASPRARAGRRRAGVARPGHQQAADDVEDSNVAWIYPPGTILPQSMAWREIAQRPCPSSPWPLLDHEASYPQWSRPGFGSNSSSVDSAPFMNHPLMLPCCLTAPISQVCMADARLS